LPLLFALTLFVSATLLFLVQPMIGKMVLPLLGGSPAVWNTCMVFFQATLLAGYLYAHAVTKRLSARTQLIVHVVLLLLPLVPLLLLGFDAPRVARDWMPPPTEANPIPWLLALLAIAAGLPFFVVATSAPLLQSWFSSTGHSAGRDPYFLYAASNLGSMLALLGYPTLVEPYLPLALQSWVWIAGYAALVLLTAVCGVAMWRAAAGRGVTAPDVVTYDTEAETPSLGRRLRGVALAFVPSSLMLGVTTYVTTDIAAIPLLWIIPLALYLLSFILVFARLPGFVHALFVLLLPAVILALLFPPPWHFDSLGIDLRVPQLHVWQSIGLHFVALFVAAMVCHGELARSRPAPAYLTEFYLCMSLGGVLGGIFNGMIAPVAFHTVVEYPLVIAAACLLLPRLGLPRAVAPLRWLDYAFAGVLGLFGVGVAGFLLARVYATVQDAERLPRFVRPYAVKLVEDYGLRDENVLIQERGFFGVVKVQTSNYGSCHQMIHGTTNHGMQCLEPERRGEPLTYFHRQGPIGQLFTAVKEMKPQRHLAVMGVGTVTLAAYTDPGWKLTLYEIDPWVVRIARDERYFTYLRDAEARQVQVDIHLGDGRLQVAKAPPGEFDILFMDAFSSDSVPVHLITKEAVEMYLTKLKPNGILVINIANRYLDFAPVLTALAEATGLKALEAEDGHDGVQDKFASHWVVLAREWQDFGKLGEYTRPDGEKWFVPLTSDKHVRVWTDDFSNLLQVFQWKY
jgi:hypothetical protein